MVTKKGTTGIKVGSVHPSDGNFCMLTDMPYQNITFLVSFKIATSWAQGRFGKIGACVAVNSSYSAESQHTRHLHKLSGKCCVFWTA